MDDVVNLVAERLALPLDEAQIAVTLVPEQLKSKAAAIYRSHRFTLGRWEHPRLGQSRRRPRKHVQEVTTAVVS